MAATKTNSQVDTLAAAIPAPYGPLTRVTNFEDTGSIPVPNSGVRGAFTSALSVTVYFTPDELTNFDLVLMRNIEAHDWTGVVEQIKTDISALNTAAGAMSTPHTYADYQTLIDLFRAMPWIRGILG